MAGRAMCTIFKPIFCAKCLLDFFLKVRYTIITKRKGEIEMDKRMFKKEGEELQQYLAFRRKAGRVPSKKGKGSYNRKEFKRGEK